MNHKSIKKNMVMSIILTVSNFLFPVITYGYISRTLTPNGVGKVAFVVSIISYFKYFASLGIPMYGIREVAKIKNNKKKLSKLVHELLTISFLSTVVSYIVLIICVYMVPNFHEQKMLFFIISLEIVLESIGVEWLYKGLEEYSYITKRSLIFKILYVPLTFIFIRSKDDILWYGFLTIFVSSANYICNFINMRKYIIIRKFKKYNIKRHLKPIIILFFATALIGIYASFDMSMLGFLKGDFDVGLYNTALKIKNIILSLSTAITAVLIPRISYHIGKKEKEEVKRLSLNSFKTTLLLAVPMAVYIFIFSENILLLLSGSEYVGAANTLRILMMCVIPLCLTNLFGNQLMIPLGMEKKFSISILVSLFINLTLNFLLIPQFGSEGASVGTLVTECWNVVFMGLCVKEYSKYVIKNSKLFRYIICLGISTLITILIGNCIKLDTIPYLIITGIIFMGSYYSLILIFKIENIKELINIKKLKSK